MIKLNEKLTSLFEEIKTDILNSYNSGIIDDDKQEYAITIIAEFFENKYILIENIVKDILFLNKDDDFFDRFFKYCAHEDQKNFENLIFFYNCYKTKIFFIYLLKDLRIYDYINEEYENIIKKEKGKGNDVLNYNINNDLLKILELNLNYSKHIFCNINIDESNLYLSNIEDSNIKLLNDNQRKIIEIKSSTVDRAINLINQNKRSYYIKGNKFTSNFNNKESNIDNENEEYLYHYITAISNLLFSFNDFLLKAVYEYCRNNSLNYLLDLKKIEKQFLEICENSCLEIDKEILKYNKTEIDDKFSTFDLPKSYYFLKFNPNDFKFQRRILGVFLHIFKKEYLSTKFFLIKIKQNDNNLNLLTHKLNIRQIFRYIKNPLNFHYNTANINIEVFSINKRNIPDTFRKGNIFILNNLQYSDLENPYLKEKSSFLHLKYSFRYHKLKHAYKKIYEDGKNHYLNAYNLFNVPINTKISINLSFLDKINSNIKNTKNQFLDLLTIKNKNGQKEITYIDSMFNKNYEGGNKNKIESFIKFFVNEKIIDKKYLQLFKIYEIIFRHQYAHGMSDFFKTLVFKTKEKSFFTVKDYDKYIFTMFKDDSTYSYLSLNQSISENNFDTTEDIRLKFTQLFLSNTIYKPHNNVLRNILLKEENSSFFINNRILYSHKYHEYYIIIDICEKDIEPNRIIKKDKEFIIISLNQLAQDIDELIKELIKNN